MRRLAIVIAGLLLCAQTPMLPGFPPGTFQNRAAIDGGSSAGPMTTPIMNNATGLGPSNSVVNYIGFSTGLWSTSTTRDTPVSIAGTISNLTFRAPTTIASGDYQIMLLKNGGTTALTCTVSAGTGPQTCTDTSNSVSVVAGDLLSWRSTPTGAPAAQTGPQLSATFTSVTANESPLFLNGNGSSPSITVANYNLFGSAPTWNATEATISGIVPTAGVISSLQLAGTAPGSGDQMVFTVFKNGTATAITCTLAGTGSGAGITTCNDTVNSVSLAAGDTLSLESCPGTVSGGICTPAATPASGGTRASLRWVPTVTGESIIMNTLVAAVSTSSVRYQPVSDTAGSTTEANVLSYAPTAFTIKNMYVALNTAPGGGVPSRVFVLRSGTGGGQANAGTPSAVGCTLTTTAACSDLTNSYAASAADLLDVSTTPANTPAATTFYKNSMVFYKP